MKAGKSIDVRIVRPTASDVPVILALIKGLAEYEKLSAEVTATEEGLRATLFGREKAADVLLAWDGDTPVGLAIYFQNYSTFLGRPGIYLEDLFVLPEWRGRGHGRRLLAEVARVALERNCGRLEWSVLDWNEPALRFYRSLGAKAMDEWTVYRMTGDAIRRLAESEKH
jgi:GNAT superfamily N-acetyltransferase